MMQALAIVLLSILAAVLYGIVHDQVTARICVEYFTIGHPPVFDTESPTLLGLGWGVIATWWVGLVVLLEPMAFRVPPEKHVAFLTDLWAHTASYVAGFVGGIALIVL